jgi:hypothetical protein
MATKYLEECCSAGKLYERAAELRDAVNVLKAQPL